jgi:hypothetical protein
MFLFFLSLWLRGLDISVNLNFNPAAATSVDSYREITVNLGTIKYQAQVADTEAQQEKGLGYREGLGLNQAMLFNFSDADYRSFWMKGMRFDLDLIWLDEHGQVLQVNENLSHFDQKTTYPSKMKIRYVLEVAAGDYARAGRPSRADIDWSR